MLAKEDNELITNTYPGTPMGELFRRFWLPVALAEELPGVDAVPVRVKVLGEDLIAFRATDGNVGLVDAYCPHRGAPMFFGRNEENGLRCVYHGWKFDIDGSCVDMPNTPEGSTYKDKVKIKFYPAVEAGDLIWAYMGPPERKPPMPDFEWLTVPKSHRYVTKFIESCNYLQAMEGDYDPSHARFLHSNLDGALRDFAGQPMSNEAPSDPNEPFPRAVGNRRVTELGTSSHRAGGLNARLEDHEQATLSINVMPQPDGRFSASVGATWWMPIFSTAGVAAHGHFSSNMRIPIDNESLMFYRLRWSWEPISKADLHEYRDSGYSFPELIPRSWMPKANISNDYEIDRVAQKSFTYTGISCFPLQDIALIEAQWGPIADRTKEHLARSDYVIIYMRRRLLKAAKELAQGQEPSGPMHPEVFHIHRETAIADTEEEAIAKAKAKALEAQFLLREAELARTVVP